METPTFTLTPSPTTPAGTKVPAFPLETPTAVQQPPAGITITEFLANPDAVADAVGEWFELSNVDAEAVNLAGWIIADQGTDRHTIAGDLWLLPGEYVVLGRHRDAQVNGGAMVVYAYDGINLANDSDRLALYDPRGSLVDAVTWGGNTALRTRPGASLERVDGLGNPTWQVAVSAWPGSAGDFGSPGQPNPRLPTPAPTLSLPTGERWLPSGSPSPLQIQEVHFDGADQEYVAIANRGQAPVDLSDWLIGDAERPVDGEGLHRLPAAAQLAPGEVFVIARNGQAFADRWATLPDAEFADTLSSVPDLERVRSLASGEFSLSDGGDEVVLLTLEGALADALAYKAGDYGSLSLTGALYPPAGYALHRCCPLDSTTDQRHQYLFAPPAPLSAYAPPAGSERIHPVLDGGLIAVWGSLGVHSTFTEGGLAPPGYLAASAAAIGLDVIAFADVPQADLGGTPPGGAPLIVLPAWHWQAGSDSAVVYGNAFDAGGSLDSFLAGLSASGGLAQWQGTNAPAHPAIVAWNADSFRVPDDLATLVQRWPVAAAPLLPAGNASPPMPGSLSVAPRYTGLAVTRRDVAGVREALAARRAWLTSSPDVWLSLHAELPGGDVRWMGQSIQPENLVRLQVDYGDRQGRLAGLAIWQDALPVRQLEAPQATGRWTVEVTAVPGSVLFAVATLADGEFAFTAPLRVEAVGPSDVLLNEVLAAPGADYNGDGLVNDDDEFIELYNPGARPVSLAGWQISDQRTDSVPGQRFSFGAGRSIAGGQRLVLWRSHSRLWLHDSVDHVRLLRPDGTQADMVAWLKGVGSDRSISRVPDGGEWMSSTPPTPGEANRQGQGRPVAVVQPGMPPTVGYPLGAPAASDDDAPPALAKTAGQAHGPPGSLAQAKRQGLTAHVEFRAQVTVPAGLFNSAIYVAEPASTAGGATLETAGLGIQVYLQQGEFQPMVEGDWVLVRGVMRTFRGEMEVLVATPDQAWRFQPGQPLAPLPVRLAEVGEPLEGRLVSCTGIVTGWQGDSIFLSDPDAPDAPALRVTVRSSLGWKRPYVNRGERWQVTGVVSQFAKEAPWNGGYRLLVRYREDLVKLAPAPRSTANAGR